MSKPIGQDPHVAFDAEPPPTPPSPTPPGWYPVGPASVRWWDGMQWTPHVAHSQTPLPRPKRSVTRTAGWVLLAAPALLLPIGGLAVMGDPYPQARFGVMSNGDVLKVVTAGCSGERLTSIELRRLAESGSNPTSIELWSVEGNAPMPADIVLGDAPGGMVETVSLAKQLGPDDRLSLLVTTDQLQQASLEFSVAEIPAAGVLGDGVTFASSEVMRAEALDKKLCTDPNGDHDKQRILHWYFVITGSISAFGAAILVATWRRKPA